MAILSWIGVKSGRKGTGINGRKNRNGPVAYGSIILFYQVRFPEITSKYKTVFLLFSNRTDEIQLRVVFPHKFPRILEKERI